MECAYENSNLHIRKGFINAVAHSACSHTHEVFLRVLKSVIRNFFIVLWYIVHLPNSFFLKKFRDFLTSTMKLSRLVIVGDFNTHIANLCQLLVKLSCTSSLTNLYPFDLFLSLYNDVDLSTIFF